MATNGNGEVEAYHYNNLINHKDGVMNGEPNVCTVHKNGKSPHICKDEGIEPVDSSTENGIGKELVTVEMARHKAFQWCRDSMGGVWTKLQSEKELTVTHISGGMSNYLYLISLPANLAASTDGPSEVLLRIYGEISKSTLDFLIHNSVVFALLAEKRLGPKPFGMYHDGRIEEYIQADPLGPTALRKPEVMTLIAEKLAVFHSLNMPLSKKPKWFKTLIRGWLKEIKSNYARCSTTISAINKLAPPSFDLNSEYLELLTVASDLQSPVVFCHNDLQGGNLLLAPDGSPLKDKMTIIDWEYAHYNYRGFDFGNHFNEWTFDYSSSGKPGYECLPENYPSKEQQHEFFKAYLRSSQTVDVTDDVLYSLFKEANTLAMHSHFLWGVWSIVQALNSSIDFDYSAYCLCRFREYFKLKKRLPALLERKK